MQRTLLMLALLLVSTESPVIAYGGIDEVSGGWVIYYDARKGQELLADVDEFVDNRSIRPDGNRLYFRVGRRFNPATIIQDISEGWVSCATSQISLTPDNPEYTFSKVGRYWVEEGHLVRHSTGHIEIIDSRFLEYAFNKKLAPLYELLCAR